MREISLAHPTVARLRSEYRVWTSSILPITERWVSVWQQSGLDLKSALVAASASSTAIIGFVEAEQLLQDADLPDDELLWPFPSARLLLGRDRDGDTEFELMVRSVIEGVHARLSGGAVDRQSTPQDPRGGQHQGRFPASIGGRGRNRRRIA